MKAILVEELINDCADVQQAVTVNIDGQQMHGYQIAKPLNYELEHTTDEERQTMADLVLQGKAIAVQFFSDLTEAEKVAYVKKQLNGQ